MFKLDRETGFSVIAIGMFIFLVGTLLLMDRALIACGNLIMIFGILGLIGAKPKYFLAKERLYGSVLFILGTVLMIFKFLLGGMILELIGLILIFRSSFPDIKSVVSNYLLGRSIYKIK
ncbi:GOT1A [Hepatospora eriocheir]|uniref:GOT1A n=1 Tax=Hepatospora eriocheir TaxID=1081669 RepID=A0A1X0Q7N6_9MICR|nr:GOT1A [Hepatospora eriocheir]